MRKYRITQREIITCPTCGEKITGINKWSHSHSEGKWGYINHFQKNNRWYWIFEK